MSDYKLIMRSPTGERIYETIDILDLAYTNVLNDVGVLRVTLRADHPMAQAWEDGAYIEVWRKNERWGLPWTLDWLGMCGAATWQTRDAATMTGTAESMLTLLRRRIIAYPASSSDNLRSTFLNRSVEQIMTTLVAYNCTALATTTNGRDRNGMFTTPTITVAASQNRGTLISWQGSRRNLLRALQDIADAHGGDFALERIGDAAFEFRYYPFLGQDRTADVVFSLERGNMTNPRLDRIPASATAIIAAGQGAEEQRDVVVVGSGDREQYLDARNESTSAALTRRAQAALTAAAPRSQLRFDPIQIPVCAYGVHYAVGDLVRASYQGYTAIMRVRSVTITLHAAAAEAIDVELEQWQ